MLTGKQEKFARLLAEGELPQYSCYLEAGYTENSSMDSIRVNACQLAAYAKIIQRVQELKDKAAQASVETAQSHAKELDRLKELALGASTPTGTGENTVLKPTPNYGAAIRAQELKGKVLGLYIDRISNETIEKVSDEELAKQLADDNPQLTVAGALQLIRGGLGDGESTH